MKHEDLYMDIAKVISKKSKALRKKVGAVLVKNDNIISFGWNGTPTDFNNKCETEINGTLVTKDEVIHAEANTIAKAAKSTASTENSILFVTLSPCFECSKLIIQSGVKEVIYLEEYRNSLALDFLKRAGVKVKKYKEMSRI